MEENRYNGWTNYETWLYNLYLDHNYYYEVVEDYANNIEVVSWTNWLADYLENESEEWAETAEFPKDGFFADMINSSIAKVNFYEIAQAIIDEIG